MIFSWTYARDPKLVADDLRKTLITADQARDIYGVLVKPETLDVDLEATSRLRAAKAKDRS
jgi:N-methylhydantoinase B/oxoprolinase/acetone carboxylase alpha subunit